MKKQKLNNPQEQQCNIHDVSVAKRTFCEHNWVITATCYRCTKCAAYGGKDEKQMNANSLIGVYNVRQSCDNEQ
jgi:hypothetical protein